MERDATTAIAYQCQAISTHTLTWSVTGAKLDDNAIIGISTHTLTWSVTKMAPHAPMGVLNFNSHAHVERDSFSR